MISRVRLLTIILGDNMPYSPKEAKESLQRRIAQIRAFVAETKLPKPEKETPLNPPITSCSSLNFSCLRSLRIPSAISAF